MQQGSCGCLQTETFNTEPTSIFPSREKFPSILRDSCSWGNLFQLRVEAFRVMLQPPFPANFSSSKRGTRRCLNFLDFVQELQVILRVMIVWGALCQVQGTQRDIGVARMVGQFQDLWCQWPCFHQLISCFYSKNRRNLNSKVRKTYPFRRTLPVFLWWGHATHFPLN